MPWSAEIYDALAATLSRMEDFPAAHHAVQAALQLQTRRDERWRVLAAILARESGTDEMISVAEAIGRSWA